MELWRALFSRTRRRVLGLLFAHPGRSFYANEIVRLAGVGTGSVQRELARLSGAGLLSVRRVGNQVHYRANAGSPFFPELRAMALKSRGVGDRVRQALAGAGGEITVAVLFGSAASLAGDGELELLVVTPDLSRARLEHALAPVGRPLRLILLRPERFHALREAEDPELARILARERLVMAGSLEQAP